MHKIIALALALSLCFGFIFFLGSCEKKDASEQETENAQKTKDAENQPINIAQNPSRYKAFAEKVQEYEEKYGVAKYVTVNEYFRYTTGLSMIKLVDFSGTGNEDLLLVYLNNPKDVVENNYAEYRYEIWGFKDEKIAMLDSGGLFSSDGGVTSVILNQRDNKWYLLTGSIDAFASIRYLGYTDEGFGVFQKIEYEDFGDSGVGLLNDKEVSMDKINQEMEIWGEAEYNKNFMFDGKDIVKENQEVKDKLAGSSN